ncbi:transaldolase [Fodinicurvata sp. EGI_FJ10296]|uniref:transaldolase n=1 Tax=Fodinicurvata sp. EGI_FJ10296 TaxID=3231908 RepID=UPI003454EF6B
MMPNRLESLKESTVIVADTGEIETIRRLKPQDCTTNPTLLFKAAGSEAYQSVVAGAIDRAKQKSGADVHAVADMLAVSFGSELLKIVPGYVSTEVDADLSFDTAATIDKAKRLIDLYADMGADTDRVLIKIASTWEGIRAAERLQKDGIKCNLTLLFGMHQAVACAEAGVTLISPFVGRIRDWFVKAGHTDFDDENDPGVVFVRRVYSYYKRHGYDTIVMGASFRTLGEIEALAGCDRLTISPALLDELAGQDGAVERKLSPNLAGRFGEDKLDASEAAFRWGMNEDAMATEKLAEGIRMFNKDLVALKKLLAEKL